MQVFALAVDVFLSEIALFEPSIDFWDEFVVGVAALLLELVDDGLRRSEALVGEVLRRRITLHDAVAHAEREVGIWIVFLVAIHLAECIAKELLVVVDR